MNENEFKHFLNEAKKATYASKNNEYIEEKDTLYKKYKYQNQTYTYEDTSYGNDIVRGHEIVYKNEMPIWSNICNGGMTKDNLEVSEIAGICRFLKEALREATAAEPIRGLNGYQKDGFLYENTISGDIHKFEGFETVKVNGEVVYKLSYAGGEIK